MTGSTDLISSSSRIRLRQVWPRVHVRQIIQKLIEAIEFVRRQRRQHLGGVFSDLAGKCQDVGFDDIETGLAVLTAPQEFMVVEFVLVKIVDVVHGITVRVFSKAFQIFRKKTSCQRKRSVSSRSELRLCGHFGNCTTGTF